MLDTNSLFHLQTSLCVLAHQVARLMMDQFRAAGSQARRGGGLCPCPRFPTLRWVGGGGGWVWLLGTGHWGTGRWALLGTRTRGVWLLPSIPWWERWSRCWGQGHPNRTNSKLADGRQNSSIQSQHRHAFVAASAHYCLRVHRPDTNILTTETSIQECLRPWPLFTSSIFCHAYL
jgi:hypothetical protein